MKIQKNSHSYKYPAHFYAKYKMFLSTSLSSFIELSSYLKLWLDFLLKFANFIKNPISRIMLCKNHLQNENPDYTSMGPQQLTQKDDNSQKLMFKKYKNIQNKLLLHER